MQLCSKNIRRQARSSWSGFARRAIPPSPEGNGPLALFCGHHRGQKLHAHAGDCMRRYHAEHDRLLDALDVQFGRERASRRFGR